MIEGFSEIMTLEETQSIKKYENLLFIRWQGRKNPRCESWEYRK